MNFFKIGFLYLFILLVVQTTFAQGETSNWYFGENAGLKFNNNGTVSPLSDGQLNTREGCATISDAFGNLLFYTDGITVWNNSHEIMSGGTDLLGNPSSTQSAIIVPQPENPDVYYIFTIDTNFSPIPNDPNSGFNYSVINMSLDNGNGQVIAKNINLLNESSEKISAVVKDCFNGSIWVITFASSNGDSNEFDTYYCYEVSVNGVNTTPVTSSFTIIRENTDPNTTGIDARGYLKISPDGTKVASANVRDGLYIYDFDTTTGVFSNQEKIELNIPDEYAYGLEFSPNSQYLYVNTYNDLGTALNLGDQHQSSLLQYDLLATDIELSQVILDQRNNLYRGALQLGNNGKIYRALSLDYLTGTSFLGVINNPDLSGTASGYQHAAINLGANNLVTQGLPPFIQSLFNKVDIINGPSSTSVTSSILDLCAGDSYTLTAQDIPGATYVWTKDGVLLPNTSYFYDLTNVMNADEGLYQLEITVNPGDCPILGEAALSVHEFPVVNDSFITQCDVYGNFNDQIAIFNLNEAANNITGGNTNVEIVYYKNINDYNNGIEINNPEQYENTIPNESIIAAVTNEGNCTITANLELLASPTTINPSTIAQYFNCDEDINDGILQAFFDFDQIQNDFSGLHASFYFTLEDLSLEINSISGNVSIENSAQIYVKIEDLNGQCLGVETFTLYIDEKPNAQLPEFIPFVCLNSPETIINGPEGYDTYSWFLIDGNNQESLVSSEQNALINEPGNYRLEVANIYTDFGTQRICSNSETFFVPLSNIAAISPQPEVNDLSDNNTITVLTEGEGNYEFALNNIDGPYQNSHIFENVPAGFLTVYVRDKNGCGIASEDVAVIGYPKFFTPNNDDKNDFWNIQGISDIFQQNTRILIFDRYGKLLKQVFPGTLGWDGTFTGQQMPASDYWFKVQLEDGRHFKGHFTLKR